MPGEGDSRLKNHEIIIRIQTPVDRQEIDKSICTQTCIVEPSFRFHSLTIKSSQIDSTLSQLWRPSFPIDLKLIVERHWPWCMCAQEPTEDGDRSPNRLLLALINYATNNTTINHATLALERKTSVLYVVETRSTMNSKITSQCRYLEVDN